jgi:YaiO family outer membrane protein
MVLYHVLQADPDYSDALILLGRTYSWDDKYDSARYFLKKVYNKNPGNKDALDALIDAELWSDHYREALDYAEKGLKKDSLYEDFMVKKVRALDKLGNHEQALKTADSFAQKSNLVHLFDIANDLRKKLWKNSITFTADADFFSNTFSPWYYSSLSYSRKTKAMGTLIARLNYANRFSTTGWQAEADAYPSVGKKMYMYLNAGYSPSSIFPVARAGVSLYRNFPKAFEGELGARFLYFSGSTIIYTGSVGKYYKNWWFSLRTFVTPGGSGVSQSFYLLSRYYLADADNYLTLRLGTGVSPDDRAKDVIFFGPGETLLSSKNIKADWQTSLNKGFYFSIRAGFSHDEVRKDFFRENPSAGITIEKRF